MFKPGRHTCAQDKVGILYFHRSLKEEFAQKAQLTSQNWSRFKALFRALNNNIHRTFESVDLPVIEMTSDQQQGTTFGDRLSHAVDSAFNQGFEHLIIVGNDCPQLNPKALKKAKKELVSGNTVIGPDQQGGAYLIGLSRNQFEQKDFASLPWQNPELFESLSDSFENIITLGQYQDLNTRKDLLAFAPKAIGMLKSVIQAIFQPLHFDKYLFPELNISRETSFYLRPPPGF